MPFPSDGHETNGSHDKSVCCAKQKRILRDDDDDADDDDGLFRSTGLKRVIFHMTYSLRASDDTAEEDGRHLFILETRRVEIRAMRVFTLQRTLLSIQRAVSFASIPSAALLLCPN